MSNDNAIRAALDLILAPHDAAWLQLFADAFTAQAASQLKEWSEYLNSDEQRNQRHSPRYVRFAKKDEYELPPHGRVNCLAALNAGRYEIDAALIAKDAKAAYTECREAFIVHAIDKVGYVCQNVDLSAARFDGSISLHRLIEGYLNVSFGSTTIRIALQVKTNYRYGSNSANGHLTQYSQYPLTFVYAVVNGEQLSGNLSEELLGNKISGLPLDFKVRKSQAEKDAKAAARDAKKALETKRRGLSDIVQAYEDIAYYTGNLEALAPSQRAESTSAKRIVEKQAEIAKLCAKHGIIDPGSKKAAAADRKALIAQIKAAK